MTPYRFTSILFVLTSSAWGGLFGCTHWAKAVPNLSARPSAAAIVSNPDQADLAKLCQDLRSEIKQLGWTLEPCAGIDWKIGGRSVEGRPLTYAEFGDPQSKNTTLVISMVHGDENTPLYLAIQLAHLLKSQSVPPSTRVVIAALVNPDGFFRKPKTRTNARNVDVNRNLNTADWHAQALSAWKKKFGSNPRRFPGHAPASEPETLFQQELIHLIKPQKILSIHAPLNFMDYDGPTTLSLARFPGDYVRECVKLRNRLRAVSGGFFPGSLGNYGGQELGIPTLTLELPSANPKNAETYWKKFASGIRTMIEFQVPDYAGTQVFPKLSRPQNADQAPSAKNGG